LIPNLTGQSQKLCVKDQLLKYQLDPTVNEVGTFILQKVCSVVNNQTIVTLRYKQLSLYLTGQSQELCVKNQLKFQLDPTVNEVGTFILQKVFSAEKK